MLFPAHPMALSMASQGTKAGRKERKQAGRQARTRFPAASGHDQSSPEPGSAARSSAGSGAGQMAFCAVASKAVWPWEDTSFSQSLFFI